MKFKSVTNLAFSQNCQSFLPFCTNLAWMQYTQEPMKYVQFLTQQETQNQNESLIIFITNQ